MTASSPALGWAMIHAMSLLQGGLVVPSLSGAATVPPDTFSEVLSGLACGAHFPQGLCQTGSCSGLPAPP